MMAQPINPELISYKDWLDSQEKSKITVAKYLRDVDNFQRFFNRSLSSLTKQDIIAYKDHLVSRYKPISVNSYLISLNRFFSFLDQEGLRVKTLKIQHKTSLNNVLTEDDYNALINTARKTNKLRIYYIIRVLASSGIRIGELQYITVDMLKTGKTQVCGKNKTREIIIPNNLCMELQQYCKDRNIQQVIFHGEKPDTLIDKAAIWRELKQLAKSAGVPLEKVHAHNFRHFFAKTFLAHYHDIVDLADILGHHSIETTRIYTRTSGNEKQTRINALNL
jgi:site-specific recombinase XerD